MSSNVSPLPADSIAVWMSAKVSPLTFVFNISLFISFKQYSSFPVEIFSWLILLSISWLNVVMLSLVALTLPIKQITLKILPNPLTAYSLS